MANEAFGTSRLFGTTSTEGSDRVASGTWRSRFRNRLRDRRFWIIQAMVLAVSGSHATTELLPALDGHEVEAIYFVPASLYFFPVLYASLSFGREGAIPTAIWSALLAVPNILLWHHGFERVGELFQVTMMIVLASIVAWRVDNEVAARHAAEATERARSRSEVKYRALFEGAAEAVLVLNASGTIEETNAAAASLLGSTTTALKGKSTVEAMGKLASDTLLAALSAPEDRIEIHLLRAGGGESWLEPLCTAVAGATGEPLVQVLLKDVTERRGLRHYAREIVRAQEEERQRIAQELHDVSVQSAIMICRRLDAAAEAADEGSADEVAHSIAEARRTAETMADELRRFSRDLRPLILDDLGLVPALKRMFSELRERSNIEVRFNTFGPVRRLDSPTELALFRIGQEALRNIETHADASSAAVSIEFGPATAVLTITDDGCGFQVSGLPVLVSAGRLGLLGMRERAQLVGGHCEIRSTPGAGTSVVAVVPAVDTHTRSTERT